MRILKRAPASLLRPEAPGSDASPMLKGGIRIAGWLAFSGLLFLLPRGGEVGRRAIDLLPIALYLLFCARFGWTLRDGRVPLITWYTRVQYHGEVPIELQAYTRHLTVMWTWLFAVFAAECALLEGFASREIQVFFINYVNYPMVAIVFLGEHLYRTWRFPQFGIASPLRTGYTIFRAHFTKN